MFFDNCLSCEEETLRHKVNNECLCKPGYYEKDSQLICEECNDLCETCTVNEL